jgi:hypothetical protein
VAVLDGGPHLRGGGQAGRQAGRQGWGASTGQASGLLAARQQLLQPAQQRAPAGAWPCWLPPGASTAPHLWAGRVLEARQPQEHEVALDGGVLGGVAEAALPAVLVAAVVVAQVAEVGGLDGKGQQAQRAGRQAVQQAARGTGAAGSRSRVRKG